MAHDRNQIKGYPCNHRTGVTSSWLYTLGNIPMLRGVNTVKPIHQIQKKKHKTQQINKTKEHLKKKFTSFTQNSPEGNRSKCGNANSVVVYDQRENIRHFQGTLHTALQQSSY